MTYEAAARESTVSTVGASGTGQSVPVVRYVYDPATGQRVRTQSLDAGGTVTAENVRTYDSLGRLTGYTDADGNPSTNTYDLLSRLATTNDGKGTRTYTYDQGAERRGLATSVADSQFGTFTGTYDLEGNITSETWPNGIVMAKSYDEVGQARALTYTRPGCGQPDCTLYTESGVASGHDEQRTHASNLGGRFSFSGHGILGGIALVGFIALLFLLLPEILGGMALFA
jgi:YD repeat-containing protein